MRESVQHQLADMHFNRSRIMRSNLAHLAHGIGSSVAARLHNQPRKSASLKGFSNFAYSLRAAAARCFIRPGSLESAAQKAAPIPRLRMLQPDRFTCANFPKFKA